MVRIVEEGLVRHDGLELVGVHPTRVEVSSMSGEVAGRHVQADPVAAAEHQAGGSEIDLDVVGFTGSHRDGRLEGVPEPGSEDPVAHVVRSARPGRRPPAWPSCAPVADYEAVVADPQVIHNGILVDLGSDRLPTVGNPVHIDGTPPIPLKQPPALGAHTEAVLREVLDLNDGQIEEARAAGAFGSG